MTQLSLCLVALVCVAVTVGAGEAPELKSQIDKASYAIGTNIGRSIKQQGIDLNMDAVIRGLQDAMGDEKLALSDEEMHKAMLSLQMEMRKKQESAGSENLKKGDAFLAANGKKDGVKTTASGLQYQVITAGKGAQPKAADKVTVHYTGKLIDGTKFDSSAGGDPISFGVGGVIPGWTEALQLMKIGAKWKLFIPAKLAYGEQGRPSIPPNSVLVFDVELLKIN